MTTFVAAEGHLSPAAVSGDPARFGARWRLVATQAFNVWRFADLDAPMPSGRGLLTGPNGTGKTTALEAFLPYLLDLNVLIALSWPQHPHHARSHAWFDMLDRPWVSGDDRRHVAVLP